MDDDNELSSVGESFEREELGVPSMPHQGDGEMTAKRRKVACSGGVTPKTLYRWKMTGAVSVDQLFGHTPGSRPEQTALADDLLNKSKLVVCCLCCLIVSANKKSIKRHQVRNRRHLQVLHESGLSVPEANITLATTMATNLLSPNPIAIDVINASVVSSSSKAFAAAAASSTTRVTTQSNPRMTLAKRITPAQAAEAWELLCHPEKVVHPEILSRTLSDLGIHDGNDLLFCEFDELKAIANTLKKVPLRRFEQIFGLLPTEDSSSLFAASSAVDM